MLKNKLLVSILITIASVTVPAQTRQELVKANPQYRNSLEFGTANDYVTEGFGHWINSRIKYTHSGTKLTWFVETSFLNRSKMGGFAFVPSVGCYMDWTRSFYTYACLTSGTKSTFTPKIRADLDLNFKFCEKKNLVLTFGASYIDYYTEQSTAIGAAGLAYYFPKGFIASYRFMFNTCFPGTRYSYTNLLSFDQGYMYRYFNTLILSYGSQSYMITTDGNPLYADWKAFSATFRHKNWIKPNWGLWGQISYSGLYDAYDTFGCGIGFFFHF